ncbi:hypothetical protein B0T14DRAFT_495690 [Immersiella caudata]|uniref:WD-like domain-containing protein n=1 Tax=Immersiella caudata TaxID=314043 RepID=A0AA39WZF1_9PEZI|nr:hypothetical protein B0T14DRAFT_495690 [Immersiella caudata]
MRLLPAIATGASLFVLAKFTTAASSRPFPPTSAFAPNWIVSSSVSTPFGELAVHSVSSSAPALSRRDPSNRDPAYFSPYAPYATCSPWELECSYRAAPLVHTCDALFRAFASVRDLHLAENDRALCLHGPGIGQCCISWSKPLGRGMQPKFLLDPAEKVRYGCVERQNMAGLVRNVDFGVCVTVCLSSKPKECKEKKEDKKKKKKKKKGEVEDGEEYPQ